PSGSGGNIGLTTSYTQFSAGVSAERIYHERDASGLIVTTAETKIAGGQGAVVQNGEITATLYRYFPGGVPSLFSNLMVALCKPCRVNTGGLVFPRVGGQAFTESLSVGPGQALFRGFGEARIVNGNVAEVPLYFGIAENWLVYDAIETADGGTSGRRSRVVYPNGDLSLLVA
ncbi:MAG: hypothetical protein AAFY46_12650, partial [Planctomycetota bacterium]